MKSLKYYSGFMSREDKSYRIEIRTEGGENPTELILSESPATVNYNSGGLFAPTIMSSASIQILTERPLEDLFTGTNQGVDLRIINETSGVTEWYGFFSPNIYSSEYNSPLDLLEVEAIDTLAALKNIRYAYINGASSEFRTFKEVLLYILNQADPDKVINKIYTQKTLRLSEDATTNLWDDLIVQEVNFYDELNEAMNLQDVLKEVMKYLGMTIIQYKDAYYIIDHLFVKNEKKDFYLYERTNGTETDVEIPLTQKDLYSDIGVYSRGVSLSIGDLYNKQTVRANRLNVQSVVPELMNEDDLVNQNADPNKYYTTQRTINNEEYTLVSAFYKSKENWNYLKPTIGNSEDEVEVTTNNIENLNKSSFWQKVDDYKTSEEPSSLNEETFMTFIRPGGNPLSSLSFEDKYLSLKKNIVPIIKGGYFIVNLNYRMSVEKLANEIITQPEDKFNGRRFTPTWIPCRMAIGDYFYNGEIFVKYDEFNLKVDRGYYVSEVSRAVSNETRTWYKYTDEYGYMRYVSESEYNMLPSDTVKEKGNYERDYIHPLVLEYTLYFFYKSGSAIYVEESYYYECLLKDRFFLVHKNKENDAIFGEEKSIDNSVSYKMNLVDSEDGLLIKVPNDKVLTGILVFELFSPNHLGVQPVVSDPDSMPSSQCQAFHISDLILKYTTVRSNGNVFDSSSNDDNDVVISNIIDSNNVQEAEDIELYINTYKDRAAYSSVIVMRNGNYDFLTTLYSEIEGGAYTAEEFLIDKLCDHYEQKRYIYEASLNRRFDFLSRIYEKKLGVTMLVASMSIDYSQESCRVKLIEP